MSGWKATDVAILEATETAWSAHVHESVNGLVNETCGLREGYARALTEIFKAEHEMRDVRQHEEE